MRSQSSGGRFRRDRWRAQAETCFSWSGVGLWGKSACRRNKDEIFILAKATHSFDRGLNTADRDNSRRNLNGTRDLSSIEQVTQKARTMSDSIRRDG